MPDNEVLPTEEITQEKKTQAMLAYIFCIPFFTKSYETSEFIKFHLNQSILLYLGAIGGNIVLGILSAIFRLFYMSWIISIVMSLFGLAVLVLWVLGILAANKGEQKALPVIGGLHTFIK